MDYRLERHRTITISINQPTNQSINHIQSNCVIVFEVIITVTKRIDEQMTTGFRVLIKIRRTVQGREEGILLCRGFRESKGLKFLWIRDTRGNEHTVTTSSLTVYTYALLDAASTATTSWFRRLQRRKLTLIFTVFNYKWTMERTIVQIRFPSMSHRRKTGF